MCKPFFYPKATEMNSFEEIVVFLPKVNSLNEGQMSSPGNIGAGLYLKASVKPLFGLGVESRRQKHVQMERVLLQTFFSLKKKAKPSRFGNSTQPV